MIVNGVGRTKSNFSTSLFDFGFDDVAKACHRGGTGMYFIVLLKCYHTVC